MSFQSGLSSGYETTMPESSKQTFEAQKNLAHREWVVKRLTEFSAAQRTLLMDETSLKPACRGVLSVKLKKLKLFNYDSFLTDSKYVYGNVCIRNQIKKTKLKLNSGGEIELNQVFHFSLTVPKNFRHPFNLIRFEFFGCERGIHEQNHLGSTAFHLHDIISMQAVAGEYDLFTTYALSGTLLIEMTFNYGLFGFGYTPQLAETGALPEEMIKFSLFPRIKVDEENQTLDGVERAVEVERPECIPFKDSNQSTGSDIETIRDQYLGMTDRVARILLLRSHLSQHDRRQESIVNSDSLNSSSTNLSNLNPYFHPISASFNQKHQQPFFSIPKNITGIRERRLSFLPTLNSPLAGPKDDINSLSPMRSRKVLPGLGVAGTSKKVLPGLGSSNNEGQQQDLRKVALMLSANEQRKPNF